MTNHTQPTWPSASKRCCSTHSTCRWLYSSHNRLHWTCWSTSCFWIRRNLNLAHAVSKRSSASLEESGSETMPFKIWWVECKWLWELKSQKKKRLELTHSPVCSIWSSILSMLGGGTPRWAAWGLDGCMLKVGVQSLIEYMHHFIVLYLHDFASEFSSSIMQKAKKTLSCIWKTSFCPWCGKRFGNETCVLQHMNQPSSACSAFLNDISHPIILQPLLSQAIPKLPIIHNTHQACT